MTHERKRRSFTTELLFWTFLFIVLPLLAISIYIYQTETASLNRIERDKSILSNRSAERSIERLGDSVLGVTITNAYWEDNRQATLKGDVEWLDVNIAVMPEVVPGIDFVAQTDMEGRVLVQAGDVEEMEGERLGFPVVLERFATERDFTGLLNTSLGVAVVAVAQVTGDTGEGEPAGLLIAGRLLDNEALVSLQSTLQTDIALMLESGQLLSSSEVITEEKLRERYDSVMQSGETFFRLDVNHSSNMAETTAILHDMAGDPIGIIFTGAPAGSTMEALAGLRSLGLYSLGIMSVMIVLVIVLLRQRIVGPLRHFTRTLQEVAAGRSVKQIPKNIMHAEAEILGAIDQIMQWNAVLEKTVEQRTAEIRVLLDNARQGFMTITPDLLVFGEHSKECERIFGQSPSGSELPMLFYSDNPGERTTFEMILKELFAENDPNRLELIESLLPEEVTIGSCIVQVNFKVLSDGERRMLMIMMTDITGTRKLENQMERERSILRMVVGAVSKPDDYAKTVEDYERFYREDIPAVLQSTISLEDKRHELFRKVHTLKGHFAMLNFVHIVPRLHELESLLEGHGSADKRSLDEYLAALKLDSWLEDDMRMLRDTLGEEVFAELDKGYEVKLTARQWEQLERRLEEALANTDQKLLRSIRRLRYKPLKQLLGHYPLYLTEIAERRGLLLMPTAWQGGEMPVDARLLQGFTASLVHMIRNIVVHGLEPPEERISSGKNEYGTAILQIGREQGELVITVGDDGRGIKLTAVREQARQLGLLDTVEEPASDEEVASLIFADRLTSTMDASEWSGRGVGLSAVKAEVEKLGGQIQVTSREGEGTIFTIRLPYAEYLEEETDELIL